MSANNLVPMKRHGEKAKYLITNMIFLCTSFKDAKTLHLYIPWTKFVHQRMTYKSVVVKKGLLISPTFTLFCCPFLQI